jgi:Putative zinc-finger
MMRDMSHDEASESLAAAALDALSAEEQAAVLAHAADCPRCGTELDQLRQALAALGNASAAAVSIKSPDLEERLKRIRLRLLARAQADRVPLDAAPGPTPASVRERRRPRVDPPTSLWRTHVARSCGSGADRRVAL